MTSKVIEGLQRAEGYGLAPLRPAAVFEKRMGLLEGHWVTEFLGNESP